MSGQQIGTVAGGVIGAVIGFYAGGNVALGWQLGAAAGGLIGGALDPTKISGPHIGQGQQQSSTDGTPIAWVIGTAKVAGTLFCVGPRREVEVDSGGKGSSTEQVTYEAHQDFAILVGESSELKNSTITSILIVEQDGKIVYDQRPESNFSSASAKWKANVDFLFGGEDQMPHPTLEAIFGAGKTPAYRGRCIVVFKDFNLTPFGDRIPSFLFTVSGSSSLIPAQSSYKYLNMLYDDGNDYSSPSFDDSGWTAGLAPFAGYGPDVTPSPQYYWDKAQAYDADFLNGIATSWPVFTVLWLRHEFFISHTYTTLQLKTFLDDHMDVFINGTKVLTTSTGDGGVGTTYDVDASALVVGRNVLAVRAFDEGQGGSGGSSAISITYFDLKLFNTGDDGGQIPLSTVVDLICARGTLQAGKWDSSALSSYAVTGYPIATQCAATDALLPALQTAFAFGTEYDNKLWFKFYGEDVLISVDDDDAVINDASEGAIQKTQRSQATEFPQKIVGQYIDPAQNYNTVAQQAERLAETVVATGESDIQMPLVITATQAKQAVDKALKVAYATLEGTVDLSVPYATASATYLKLAAGEPFFQGLKRWVADEVDIGAGYLKLSGRYDRQSAYSSSVQPITGNTPTPPISQFSGPTDMMVMNLPSLQTQDTYGVYVTVKGEDSSWRNAAVQVSYDNQQSWTTAFMATKQSVMGTVVSDETTSYDSETIVDVGDGQISSITIDQLNANGNAFAIVDNSDVPEIRQAQYADEQSDGTYRLTGQRTGLLGTTFVNHAAGEKFTMLRNAYFLPIDLSFKGATLYFRAVGGGEVADQQPVIELVYNPDTTVIVDGGKVT